MHHFLGFARLRMEQYYEKSVREVVQVLERIVHLSRAIQQLNGRVEGFFVRSPGKGNPPPKY